MSDAAALSVEQVFRLESGRAVATLVRLFGDIDIAEEAVQDAFVVAAQSWPEEGVPPNPGGWIVTTARNRAIDRFRRESSRYDRYVQAALAPAARGRDRGRPDERRSTAPDLHVLPPGAGADAQVALTLRLLGGLQTREIARAFLVEEATMAQRLVRAKNKIRAANIPYRIPSDAELADRLRRLDAGLAVPRRPAAGDPAGRHHDRGLAARPEGLVFGVIGLLIRMTLGTALALMFSAANVFLRDVSNAVNVLSNFVRFGVPMMYPYMLVAVRFHGHTDLYLLNPITEAVLDFQRAFWVGCDSNPARTAAIDMPPNLFWL